MNAGKTLFAQIMDFLPWTTFDRYVDRYGGNRGVRSMTCAEQYRIMGFAQLTYRESLQDIEVCLGVALKSVSFTTWGFAVTRRGRAYGVCFYNYGGILHYVSTGFGPLDMGRARLGVSLRETPRFLWNRAKIDAVVCIIVAKFFNLLAVYVLYMVQISQGCIWSMNRKKRRSTSIKTVLVTNLYVIGLKNWMSWIGAPSAKT
jgi:hypothetical protein